MAKTLVIVESPTKARTMARFLPKEYRIVASVGHVRDLPQSAKDIPERYKEQPWASLGIDVENDFEPLYIIPRGKSKIIKELKANMKQSDEIILATDEDREGESISWHLATVLKPSIPIKRMAFHEITARAIKEALNNFREIDMQLVRAQETRRILDRLFGYTLSPVIWKKIAFGLSAGRVQSPGLRMLTERERERMRHVSTTYWDLLATVVHDGSGKDFEARLVEIDGARAVSSKDFDSITGERQNNDARLLSEKECASLVDTLQSAEWVIESITEKESKVHPPIPFITATLQQHANRRLRLSSRETMRVAQRLYESGKITYMRTDSPHLSQEATDAARTAVKREAGEQFLSEKARYFKGGAGEAHEAIRPAGERFAAPKESGLSGRELALYTMIWQRTLATQMKAGVKRGMKVMLRAANTRFEATGTRVVFPGFLKIYGDDRLGETLLPAMNEGDRCHAQEIAIESHTTRPPARFTEAALIQQLEARGIGRPSTYASIISTLYDRGYVYEKNHALIPTFTGIAVVQLLETHFNKYVEYSFTSDMERVLDEIAVGQRDNIAYLRTFYSDADGLEQMATKKEQEIDAESMRIVSLPQFDPNYQIRIGRYGPYVVHKQDGEEFHASIPQDIAPGDLTVDMLRELIENQRKGPQAIAQDPESNKPIYLLTGRYGPYLQIGENDDEPKPKRASVPKEYKPSDVTPEIALKLLSLPRSLGAHPKDGEEIIANRGRFGPYIKHGSDTRSLKKGDDVYTIELDRAVELLATPKAAAAAARRSQLIRELGKEGKSNQTVGLYNGKYGAYLKVGTKNIPLPEEMRTPEALEKLDLEAVKSVIS